MMLIPEAYMFGFSVYFLYRSLGRPRAAHFAAARALVVIGLLVALVGTTARGEFFSGAYRVDYFSQLFKFLLVLALCLVLFMFESDEDVERDYIPEYIMFLGFSSLGLMMLVSSVELISIAVSLEISSFSLYAIVPLRRFQSSMQLEASMKYLFFGAVTTGIMLYGMGYLYGMAHSTYLIDIMPHMEVFLSRRLGLFALILVLMAFFFKLSLFPLHYWAPDIYEGASNVTTTFIATVPKIAAAALLLRLVLLGYSVPEEMTHLLLWLAIASMTLGNLAGLVQKDLKRLLAYSGIAHAGYVIMGVLPLSAEAGTAVIYYMTVYLFMNLACFYVIIRVSPGGANASLADLSGLHRRSPLLACTLAVAAFSLAGIPPTGGFTGKFFLFVNAFRSGYLNIVIIGVVNTVISLFYYLNLVRMSYSRDSAERAITLAFHEKVLCCIFILLILYLGILPFGLLDLFRHAL